MQYTIVWGISIEERLSGPVAYEIKEWKPPSYCKEVNPFSHPSPTTLLALGRNPLSQGRKIAPRTDPGISAGCRCRHEHHKRRGLFCVRADFSAAYLRGRFRGAFVLSLLGPHHLTTAGWESTLPSMTRLRATLSRVCNNVLKHG